MTFNEFKELCAEHIENASYIQPRSKKLIIRTLQGERKRVENDIFHNYCTDLACKLLFSGNITDKEYTLFYSCLNLYF